MLLSNGALIVPLHNLIFRGKFYKNYYVIDITTEGLCIIIYGKHYYDVSRAYDNGQSSDIFWPTLAFDRPNQV